MNAGRIFLFAASFFALSACGKTIVDGGDRITDGPTTVVLKVSDSAEELITSRTTDPGTEDERMITSIEVWAFRAEGETDAGSLAKYVRSTSSETTVTFVMNGGKYDFYVVANQQVGSRETKAALLSEMSSCVITHADSRAVPLVGFPMVGVSTGFVLDGAQPTHQLSVLLKRRVAKIESPTATAGLKVKTTDATGLDALLPGVAYDPEAPNLDFHMTGFVVVNGIDKSWLFHASQRAADWTLPAGGGYRRSTFETDGSYSSVYSGISVLGPPHGYFLDPNVAQADRPVIYAHENYPAAITLEGGTVGYDRGEVYAMIVRGTVSETGTPANTVTRYWRINLMRGSPTSPQDFRIEQGKVYRINIDEIRTLGYATPKEAEDEGGLFPVILPSGQSSMTISCRVEDWEVFPEGVIL